MRLYFVTIMNKIAAFLVANVISNVIYADNGVYCPQKAGFVRVGMTQEQVLSMCGEPRVRQKSNQLAIKRVEVQQLFFEHHGGPNAFNGVWQIPGGYPMNGGQDTFSSNSGGQTLEIDVIDNKVAAIKLNGGSLNSLSTCDAPLNVGDDVSEALYACGNPTKENDTYVNMPIPSKKQPELWIYQSDQYHPVIRMMVVDGRVASIN